MSRPRDQAGERFTWKPADVKVTKKGYAGKRQLDEKEREKLKKKG